MTYLKSGRETRSNTVRRSKKKSKSTRKETNLEYQFVPTTNIKQSLKIFWNVAFYIVMIGVLVGAVLFKFDNSPTKSFYGHHFMTVKTNSMAASKKTKFTDGFSAGSFIIIKKVDPNSLKVDDIITFFPVPGNTKAYLTHRIIEVETPINGQSGEETKGITTQGDANDGPDFPIEKSAIVGKVIWNVKNGGHIVDFIREKYIVVAILVGVLFTFTMTLKYYMSIPTLQPKRRRR